MERLLIENIRSILNIEVPLKRINVIIGKNASGKSSIIYSLLALRNLIRMTPESKYAFQSMKWLRRRGSDEAMRVGLIGTRSIEKEIKFSLDCMFLPSLSHNSKLCIQNSGICETDMTSRTDESDVLKVFEEMNVNYQDHLQRLSEMNNPFGCGLLSDRHSAILLSNDNSLSLLADWINYDYKLFEKEDWHDFRQIRQAAKSFIFDMEFIPVTRGSFSTISQQQDLKPSRISDGEDAPHEFLNMLIYPDLLDEHAFQTIKMWAKAFGIDDFEAVIQPGRKVEGRGCIYDEQKIPVSLYGFGSNQFLHVIAKCVFARPEAPILIEEPEIHLHPQFQALAADFLIETMKNNHQVFITTHSEHILGRIQRRIADRTLSADDVSILWTNYDSEERTTKVERVPINEDGVFPNGIQTFLDFEKDEMSEIYKARANQRP